jgi:hypothetical protein
MKCHEGCQVLNYTHHDRLIAKLQHFAELLKHTQAEKEILLVTNPIEDCQKERLKEAISVYEQISKEYYHIFEDILHR